MPKKVSINKMMEDSIFIIHRELRHLRRTSKRGKLNPEESKQFKELNEQLIKIDNTLTKKAVNEDLSTLTDEQLDLLVLEIKKSRGVNVDV